MIHFARLSKPPLVSAMGIFSIVLAGVAMIGGVALALQAIIQIASASWSKVSVRIANTSIVQSQAASVPALPTGAFGLSSGERLTAVNVMSGMAQLPLARQAQLDALLAQGGQTILGMRQGAITSGGVRAAITSHSRGRASGGTAVGPDLFVMQSGTIELYDANAVFRSEGRSVSIRVAADVERYRVSLNAPDEGDSFPPQPMEPGSSPPSTMPAASSSATGPRAALSLDSAAQTLVFTDAGLSFLLAVYLLVTGILTTRGSQAGGWLHWIFVLLKLPLLALTYHAWSRFEQSYALVLSANSPGRAIPGWFSTFPITLVLLGAIYPVALLFVLCMPTVRGFYGKAK